MIIKPSTRLAEIKEYYFSRKLGEIAQLNLKGKEIINLGIGSPDLQPPKEVQTILSQSMEAHQAHSYQSYRGIEELRSAFASMYARNFQVELNPASEVLPLIGSKEGIMHISMSFLNEGDIVLVPNPGYPSYAASAKLAGAQVVHYELDDENDWLPNLDTIDPTVLKKAKLMWVNYPNMPTGAMATSEFFEKLIAFARRHEILVCNDSAYNFILNPNPISILQIPEAKEVALELTSLSKSHNMAGWRVGSLMGKSDYLNTVLRFKSNMDSGMFKPIQLAASKALELGPHWSSELNAIYEERRKHVWKILESLDCSFPSNSAGLFVWAKVPNSVANVENWIDELLQNAGVFITPGFIFGDKGKRYIRISLCNDIPSLQTALKRIEQTTKIEVPCR